MDADEDFRKAPIQAEQTLNKNQVSRILVKVSVDSLLSYDDIKKTPT